MRLVSEQQNPDTKVVADKCEKALDSTQADLGHDGPPALENGK